MYKLLLVDDNPDINRANQSLFAENGFEVVVAETGEDALKLCAEHNFDCIVLDIILPGKDGYTVCTEIRKTSTTPIIFLSSKGDLDDKVWGLMLGSDDYLAKPYSLSELYARVVASVRRSEMYTNTYGGDFYIDHMVRLVHYKGQNVTLSRKEFTLLQLLLLKPGDYVSKDELAEQLWPYANQNRQKAYAALKVHISNLRRKTAFCAEYLGTITSCQEGYRLELSKLRGENIADSIL